MAKQIIHLHIYRRRGDTTINTTLCGRMSNAGDDINNTENAEEVTCKLCLARLKYRKVARAMDPRPYVNNQQAKKLRARGKIEGQDYVIPKHCLGQRHHLCVVCMRIIRRYDQRCRP